MKKLIMIACLISLSSCVNDTPKCDDKEINQTVISLLTENKNDLTDNNGNSVGLFFNNENDGTIKNIMTKSKDNELKICNCEGTYQDTVIIGNINYTAQKNSEGEIIVKIENAGPFELQAFKKIKNELNLKSLE